MNFGMAPNIGKLIKEERCGITQRRKGAEFLAFVANINLGAFILFSKETMFL